MESPEAMHVFLAVKKKPLTPKPRGDMKARDEVGAERLPSPLNIRKKEEEWHGGITATIRAIDGCQQGV
jgi:hypothetical protein